MDARVRSVQRNFLTYIDWFIFILLISKFMGKVSVSDLFSLLPDDLLDNLSQSTDVDKWVSKLPGKLFIKLLLYSVLNNERLSLREISSEMSNPIFQSFSSEMVEQMAGWTGIRERLRHIKLPFIEQVYEHFFAEAHALYGEKKLLDYHIKRYDSTLIKVFGHLLQGMKVGNTSKNKFQVKLTTEHTDGFGLRVSFHQDQAHLSEETALQEQINLGKHSSQDIIVFDNGLKGRRKFKDFDEASIQFVTNIGKKPRYQVNRPHQLLDRHHPDLDFIQDSVVQLFERGQPTNSMEHEFRLIEFRVKETGKHLFILSNLWDLPAEVVAQVYLMRWDIEVIFRFLKQEMNLTHFVCNDLNAIKVMIYVKLIAAMMILIFKQKNAIKTYKRAKKLFLEDIYLLIIVEMMESPDLSQWFLKKAKKRLKRE
ncbi:IS4 family transposase [Microscilla marina]|nr:IS4 family transposase [Microscilla marina]